MNKTEKLEENNSTRERTYLTSLSDMNWKKEEQHKKLKLWKDYFCHLIDSVGRRMEEDREKRKTSIFTLDKINTSPAWLDVVFMKNYGKNFYAVFEH